MDISIGDRVFWNIPATDLIRFGHVVAVRSDGMYRVRSEGQGIMFTVRPQQLTKWSD